MENTQLLACLAAVAAMLLVPGALAQSNAGLMSNLPPPGSLNLVHYFPDHPTKQFPAGEIIRVVVSAHNDASKPYNLTAIMGSLNSPNDYNLFLYNFTEQIYQTPVLPGHEVSLEYAFRPDPSTPPRDFTVALHLFYMQDGQLLANTFFNETVDIVEPKRLFDWGLLFMLAQLAFIVAVAGYFAANAIADKMGFKLNLLGKGRRAKRAAGAAPKEIDEDEWVKGTGYDLAKRKKATQRNRTAGAVSE